VDGGKRGINTEAEIGVYGAGWPDEFVEKNRTKCIPTQKMLEFYRRKR
jgi:hypothetical protein